MQDRTVHQHDPDCCIPKSIRNRVRLRVLDNNRRQK
jgi:hypothetical protein